MNDLELACLRIVRVFGPLRGQEIRRWVRAGRQECGVALSKLVGWGYLRFDLDTKLIDVTLTGRYRFTRTAKRKAGVRRESSLFNL